MNQIKQTLVLGRKKFFYKINFFWFERSGELWVIQETPKRIGRLRQYSDKLNEDCLWGWCDKYGAFKAFYLLTSLLPYKLCQGWSSSMGNSYGWGNEKDKLTTGKW